MSNRKIIYPISGNPPTWGHADIMMRASQKFDELYWVAATNPNKPETIFSEEERTKMMQDYVDYYDLKNVKVISHSGTMVRLAQDLETGFLLRGLRNTTDFQHELEMASGNRGIDKNIETICMFTKPHFATISSTLVRELALLGERIDQYVLPSLTKLILDKFKNNLVKKK
ncbi:MAG: pantetheine-phosphate adenylyltransferase [Bacteriovoracaceae bacterium]|jgi:pantetheine-phosphate adenylyltransferase|nr:pantetheine-phosphate adenylyltransferase [Bacteriovoracaceae bacterium]